jgi:hypothetical protein
MLKTDSYWKGLLVGMIFPLVCFGVLFGIKTLIGLVFQPALEFPVYKLIFASIVLNVLPVRFFYVAWNLPKIAQGMLLITVVAIITILLSF